MASEPNTTVAGTSGPGFKDLPPEIRNEIYRLHFKLRRPVVLTSDKDDQNFNDTRNHLANCLYGDHIWISRKPSPTSKCLKRSVYCHSPLKDTTLVKIAPSVLSLLQVSKFFHKEAMPFFYQLNTFHFRDMEHVLCVARSMASKEMGGRNYEIRNITFRFKSTGANKMLPEIAMLFPKLEKLSLLIDYHSRHIILNKGRTLRTARGIPVLRDTFKQLTNLNLYGIDRIKRGDNWSIVSLNHKCAVGPWLRDAMVEDPIARKNRLSAEAERVKERGSKKRKAEDGSTENFNI